MQRDIDSFPRKGIPLDIDMEALGISATKPMKGEKLHRGRSISPSRMTSGVDSYGLFAKDGRPRSPMSGSTSSPPRNYIKEQRYHTFSYPPSTDPRGTSFGSGICPQLASTQRAKATQNDESKFYKVVEYYMYPESELTVDNGLVFVGKRMDSLQSAADGRTMNHQDTQNQSMTLAQLDNLCIQRQKEIEIMAASRANSQQCSQLHNCSCNPDQDRDRDSWSSTLRNSSMCPTKDKLAKSLSITVKGLARAARALQKAIDTANKTDPTDPAELSKILAERLLNKTQNLVDIRDLVKAILKDLHNIMENDFLISSQIECVLQDMDAINKPECLNCCSCGSRMVKPGTN